MSKTTKKIEVEVRLAPTCVNEIVTIRRAILKGGHAYMTVEQTVYGGNYRVATVEIGGNMESLRVEAAEVFVEVMQEAIRIATLWDKLYAGISVNEDEGKV